MALIDISLSNLFRLCRAIAQTISELPVAGTGLLGWQLMRRLGLGSK
jgi:hypothetical protein